MSGIEPFDGTPRRARKPMPRGILPYLDVFVAVARAGSFGAAARALHLAQSTVSYQIRQIERRLGAPVFERLARGVQPTAAGRRLLAGCEQLVDEIESLRAGGADAARAEPQRLRIVCGSSFGRYVLTPILTTEPFAEVALELRFGSDDEVFGAVSNGQADLGFAYGARPAGALRFAPVYRERLVLVAAAGRGAPARPTAAWITAAGFVTYGESDAVYARWFEAVLGAMPARLQALAHCAEIEEAAAFVAARRGLAVVPRHAVARELAARRLRRLRLAAWPEVTNVVYAVTRAAAPPLPAAAALLAAIPAG